MCAPVSVMLTPRTCAALHSLRLLVCARCVFISEGFFFLWRASHSKSNNVTFNDSVLSTSSKIIAVLVRHTLSLSLYRWCMHTVCHASVNPRYKKICCFLNSCCSYWPSVYLNTFILCRERKDNNKNILSHLNVDPDTSTIMCNIIVWVCFGDFNNHLYLKK